MSDPEEIGVPGVTRRVASNASSTFAPFISLNGAATSLAAGLSRDENKYNSVPMASITLRVDGELPGPAFTIALDDLVFLNLVLSSSIGQILQAYEDGAVSNIQEPADTAKALRGLTSHWAGLTAGIDAYADKFDAVGQSEGVAVDKG